MVGQVRDLIQARHEGSLSFDLNARGKSKSNCGWAALHLACYFGHGDVVGCLLQNGADINALNRAGDTPLHKSAFTGRVNIVMMLLHYNADVFQINGEGQTARDVASNQEVKHILQAAEQAELFAIEGRFLDAAREGNVDVLNSLLKSNHPPRLNCTDTSGNTALHCASYRDQKEVAVILLQNGLDTNILNNRGQAAMDLAHTPQMKQLLGVKPIKEIQKLVHRFEGPLARKSRVLGSWKQWWVVVERGVISYFNHRADGSSGIKRKHYKYMEDATINMKPGDDYAFVITFSDKSCHTLSVVPREEGQKVSRQRWINAVQLHICYSSNLVRRGGRYAGSDEDDEAGELQHLGSMQDALEIAVANHQVLEKQVADVCHLVEQSSAKAIMSSNTHVDVGTELSRMVGTSRQVLSSLSHCLAVCKQSEEIHRQHLKEAQEKSRVLEDALHALAKEHHELEHSLAMSVRSEGKQEFYSPFPSPQQYQSDDDDIFFDADDES
ncbi:PREDICTED: oxysterol-binding protein-related protein 1-like [Priapulus caudatus]|uniref:Oxysterol-binding protein-related protein 1-like n=1 Tax=Priapulus caudatus TaxID=37621 RepID=A0ABM1EXJ4_PRICU|nr:PREDICTED: oxysterol-binding protein-related protein 1-like [Priapulus caudatus]